ncbi:hypothetical protein UFOVP1459_33 [uncultured Caudovirales phage]|uniref:Uncharacterized protein n=1 Tax=uncultured Caudovirales phage TaxID=2100421 RepID=A0A6J5SIZ7_9CAUD|nr:hypothetical protein UFOVP1459_33 [uncultured Caudovirales phage]CAB4218217.1 hypothetical protein UFOVP1609_7 [uncultured Caudovirales phage]
MGILDFFTGGGEYADPNAIDERYGVSKGDVRQAALNTLGNVSGLLLAAGQPMSGSQRAQLLGQLGPAFGGAQTDIYNAAQRRLLGAENEQKMAEMQRMRAFAERVQRDPEGVAAELGTTADVIKNLTPAQLQTISAQKASNEITMSPFARAENEQKMGEMQQLKSLADEMKDPAAFTAKYGFNPSGLPPQTVRDILTKQLTTKALETNVDRKVSEMLSGGGNGTATASVGDGTAPTVQSPGVDSFLRFQEQQNGSGTPPTDAAGNTYEKYMKIGQYYMSNGRPEDAKKFFDAAKEFKPEAAKPPQTQIVNGTLYEYDDKTRKYVPVIEAAAETLKPEQILSATSTIRKEFTSQKVVQDFIGSQSTLVNMTDSANRANAAAPGTKQGVLDVALIKNFFLTMEPGLAVNQGEFGTIALAKSLDDRFTTALKAVDTGESLTPEIRNELVNVARQKVMSTYGSVKTLEDWYASIAEDAGIKPENVKLDLRNPLVKKIMEDEAAAIAAQAAAVANPPTPEELAKGGVNLVGQIKATTNAKDLLALGRNFESWDDATKAAYAVRLDQVRAGVQ